MKKLFLPLEALSLKRRIFIAFCLISLLPLLVVGFYLAYKNLPSYTYLILGINILLGWWIIVQILNSITSIIKKTQENFSLLGEVKPTEDEVKLLDEIFDKMTVKVRKSFQELREISKTTEKLNEEVSEKIALLSAILQINDLVSQGTDIKEVFRLIVRRIKSILNFDLTFILLDLEKGLFSLEAGEPSQNINFKTLSKDDFFLKPLIEKGEVILLDQNNPRRELENFSKDILGVNNLVLLPIFLKREIIGILGAGVKSLEFSFSEEELDTLKTFSKHISFIIEHQRISKRIKDLEINDPLTGLYNAKFAKERLDEEVKRAIVNQRPCGFILIKIKNFRDYIDKIGVLALESVLKKIANIMKDSLEVGQKAVRISEDSLGIIAPEKSKAQLEKQGSELLAKIKQEILAEGLDLVFSVAENPIDGASAEELISKASSI
ncbi:MAG: hypothetical protein DRP80_01805 [Candidatus Omnitrophota bacterium]|nr:MAG: hypothetical protein DRP80_01805 [Candidatus Omnitrophota bacterium]